MYTFQETVVDGGGSGSIQGVSYFECSKGHGLFLPLSRVRKDTRFHDSDTSSDTSASEHAQAASETTAGHPTSTQDPFDLLSKLMGDTKGMFRARLYLSDMSYCLLEERDYFLGKSLGWQNNITGGVIASVLYNHLLLV